MSLCILQTGLLWTFQFVGICPDVHISLRLCWVERKVAKLPGKYGDAFAMACLTQRDVYMGLEMEMANYNVVSIRAR